MTDKAARGRQNPDRERALRALVLNEAADQLWEARKQYRTTLTAYAVEFIRALAAPPSQVEPLSGAWRQLIEAARDLLEAAYQADAREELPHEFTGELLDRVRDALIAVPVLAGEPLSADAPRVTMDAPTATMRCPICGESVPHAHVDGEILDWLNAQGSRFGVSVIDRRDYQRSYSDGVYATYSVAQKFKMFDDRPLEEIEKLARECHESSVAALTRERAELYIAGDALAGRIADLHGSGNLDPACPDCKVLAAWKALIGLGVVETRRVGPVPPEGQTGHKGPYPPVAEAPSEERLREVLAMHTHNMHPRDKAFLCSCQPQDDEPMRHKAWVEHVVAAWRAALAELRGR